MASSMTPRFVGCARMTNVFDRLSCLLTMSSRLFSSQRKGETVMNVFDRRSKRIQRDRTTLMKDYKVYEYLKEEFGYRVADRVLDVKREFDILVDLGCGRGYASKHLLKDTVKSIYQCELSEKMLLQSEVSPEVPTQRIVMDEEFLPFKDESLDIVISSLSLHWVNDLPGCFRQVHNALKKDGVFLGCLFGGDTLYELRVSLQLAEQEKEGGFAAHVSPFTSVQDLGNLLNRAGFTMLTIDIDEMVITYPTIHELMHDLKGMAENNCAWSRKSHLRRSTTERAGEIYKEMYGNEQGVPATYQVIYFIGWRPHPSQPKPAQRGSGQISLKDLENFEELANKLSEDTDKNSPASSNSDKDSNNKDDSGKS
ncbi:arginine-hydroxylase NDUFAF5, mitochondrial-like [Mercenaria mercenaria]|uniref:arginine-hydroxylase NDUFAF5, mitochondrial-like n=1 Tax=Mercenaria mercenaria TaxID=6596 RepID=UPI00234F100F|nr:arginine-hydroxylase NDUFAF5, mitochondrial-like [Mercenaria mercenaria]